MAPTNTKAPNNAKAPTNARYIDSRFDSLSEENALLRSELDKLRDRMEEMNSELVNLQFLVSENIVRREAVETDLVSVNSKLTDVESGLSSVSETCASVVHDQGRLQSALEIQAQYSRLSTLLLSGRAIPDYDSREDTRMLILAIIREHLGITIHPLAVSACHRLRNKNFVLLRFVNKAEREAVYRRRTKPVKMGLLVHESLTAERLSVVKLLKSIHHPKEASPLQSHYTNQGRIYIKPKGAQRAVEVPVGSSRADILSLCGIREAPPSPPAAAPHRERMPTLPLINTIVKSVCSPPSGIPTPRVCQTDETRSSPPRPAPAHGSEAMSLVPDHAAVGSDGRSGGEAYVVAERVAEGEVGVAITQLSPGLDCPHDDPPREDDPPHPTVLSADGRGPMELGCDLLGAAVPASPANREATGLRFQSQGDSALTSDRTAPSDGIVTGSPAADLSRPQTTLGQVAPAAAADSVCLGSSSPVDPQCHSQNHTRSRSGRTLKVPPHKFSEHF